MILWYRNFDAQIERRSFYSRSRLMQSDDKDVICVAKLEYQIFSSYQNIWESIHAMERMQLEVGE
jgi:hypothetical protein